MIITGTYTKNGHSFTIANGSAGNLTTPDGSLVSPEITTDLSGDQSATDVTVLNKETATLTGTRQDISINTGGILKGTGTAHDVTVLGGIVAPGNSPGTLTILNAFNLLDGTYQAEILNAETYDQLKVAEGVTTGTPVSLSGILDTVLYDGWVIEQGDQFKIIDNLSTTAVGGGFTGLAEGAQFTVDGITFSISYVGGDGNDVVITALNTGSDPDAPNTGAQLLKLANPSVILGLGILSAGILFAVSRRRHNN